MIFIPPELITALLRPSQLKFCASMSATKSSVTKPTTPRFGALITSIPSGFVSKLTPGSAVNGGLFSPLVMRLAAMCVRVSVIPNPSQNSIPSGSLFFRPSRTTPPPRSTLLTTGKLGRSEAHCNGVKAMKSEVFLKAGRVEGSTISRFQRPTIALTSINLPATKSIGNARTARVPGFSPKNVRLSFALEMTDSRVCEISLGAPLDPDVLKKSGLSGF